LLLDRIFETIEFVASFLSGEILFDFWEFRLSLNFMDDLPLSVGVDLNVVAI
jgi:hypothetical protein